MNKEQQELLDEAYENYLNNFIEPQNMIREEFLQAIMKNGSEF